jgi:hypothetical protein
MMSDASRLVRPRAVAQWSTAPTPQVSIAKLPEKNTMRLQDVSRSIEQRVGSDRSGLREA